jgi:elongation factor Ts
MMDCKAALVEAEGDMQRAIEILREKGKAAAAKKAGRATSEGLAVAKSEEGQAAGLVVECETDFVALNENFRAKVQELLDALLKEHGAGEFKELGDSDTIDGKTLAEHAAEIVGVIRENIQIPRAVAGQVAEGEAVVYNHHNGKAAAIIAFKGSSEAAYKVAVHTVAMKPEFLKREDVPQEVVDKEVEVQTRRTIEEGKPADKAEMIARGRVNKEFFMERVLMEQPIYFDGKVSVGDWFKQNGGQELLQFVHLAVGQSAGEGEEGA